MKRIIATLVLTCALSVSALAGEIPTCSPTAATATGHTVGSQPIAEAPTNGSTVPSVLTDVWLTLLDLIVR